MENTHIEEKESKFSIIELVILLIENKRTMIRVTSIFIVIGMIIYIVTPSEYRSTAKLFPEVNDYNDMPNINNLANLGKMIGVDIGAIGEGGGVLSVTYLDILTSREVLYKVLHEPFFIPSQRDTLKLITYLRQESIFGLVRKYTIGLPRLIKKFLLKKVHLQTEKDKNILYLTEEEEESLLHFRQNVRVEKDFDSGIINLSVTCTEPFLAAKITEKIIQSFKQRVRKIYNERNKKNYEFIDKIYNETEKELFDSENQMIQFLTKNTNIQTPELQIEHERLTRKVDLKTSVFREVQTKLTNLKIALKRNEPVITILERPNIPTRKSSLGLTLNLFLSIILGILSGIFTVYLKHKSESIIIEPAFENSLKKIQKLFKKN